MACSERKRPRRVKELEAALKEKVALINQLEADHAEAVKQQEKESGRVAAQKDELLLLSPKANKLGSELRSTQDRFEEATSRLEWVESEIARFSAELPQAEQALSAKDAQIADLDAEVARLTDALTTSQDDLWEKDALLAEIESSQSASAMEQKNARIAKTCNPRHSCTIEGGRNSVSESLRRTTTFSHGLRKRQFGPLRHICRE